MKRGYLKVYLLLLCMLGALLTSCNPLEDPILTAENPFVGKWYSERIHPENGEDSYVQYLEINADSTFVYYKYILFDPFNYADKSSGKYYINEDTTVITLTYFDYRDDYVHTTKSYTHFIRSWSENELIFEDFGLFSTLNFLKFTEPSDMSIDPFVGEWECTSEIIPNISFPIRDSYINSSTLTIKSDYTYSLHQEFIVEDYGTYNENMEGAIDFYLDNKSLEITIAGNYDDELTSPPYSYKDLTVQFLEIIKVEADKLTFNYRGQSLTYQRK